MKISKHSKTESPMNKCIISIDVGVKNLAICVLYQDDVGSINVPFWKWYNVVDITDTPVRKSVKGKTKKDKGDEIEYGECQNVIRRTNKPCGKKGMLNTRGRAYCGLHDPSKKHKPRDTQEWCYAMLQKLPLITNDIIDTLKKSDVSYDEILSVLQVVIEQQSMDNKKILLQSHLIFGHFVSLFSNKITVRFTPAYNKLLVYNGPEILCTLKTAYAKRKFLARKHTEYFLDTIDGMNDWKEFFVSCKTKQDDISDAFLQGLYVLEKGIKIKESEIDKPPPFKKRRRKVKF